MAVAQALANDVASSVFAPPLRVSTRYCFSVGPAYLFGIVIEKSRSPLPTAAATAISRTVRRRAHLFLGSSYRRERERGDYQSANARWWWCTNWVTTGERIFLSLIAPWAFEETHVLILTAHWALAEIGKIEWIRIPLEV